MDQIDSGKTILIIEPDLSGHHMRYLEWIACGFVARGFRVAIATADENKNDKRLEKLNSSLDGLHIFYFDFPSHLLRSSGLAGLVSRELSLLAWMERAASSVKSVGPLHQIFIPYLDYCLYAIALKRNPFCSVAWSGITMRPSFHYSAVGVVGSWPSLIQRIKKALFGRVLKKANAKAIYTIDPTLMEFVSVKFDKWSGKLHYLADPVKMKKLPGVEEARRKLGMDEGAFTILVYGALDPRKGIHELLRATTAFSSESSLVLILAGRQSDGVRGNIESFIRETDCGEKRIICFDRYVDDEEEALLFAAADVVWLGYVGHLGMSGVLAQAGIASKPVIGCRDGLIGWWISKFNLGLSISPHINDEVVSAIHQLRENKKLCAELGRLGSAAFANHNVTLFLSEIAEKSFGVKS